MPSYDDCFWCSGIFDWWCPTAGFLSPLFQLGLAWPTVQQVAGRTGARQEGGGGGHWHQQVGLHQELLDLGVPGSQRCSRRLLAGLVWFGRRAGRPGRRAGPGRRVGRRAGRRADPGRRAGRWLSHWSSVHQIPAAQFTDCFLDGHIPHSVPSIVEKSVESVPFVVDPEALRHFLCRKRT